MHPTKIDWPWKPLHVWNPIVGCKRNCEYCYAKDLHTKRHIAFKEGKLQNCKQYALPFEKIQTISNRFDGPFVKNPKNVFVNSMSDPAYWSMVQLTAVNSIMKTCNQHTFILLTKTPGFYKKAIFPRNVILGITITGLENSVNDYIDEFFLARWPNHNKTFLSIEPLLGILPKISASFSHVVCGALSGKGAEPPKKEWIQSVRNSFDEDRIYWKANMRKFV